MRVQLVHLVARGTLYAALTIVMGNATSAESMQAPNLQDCTEILRDKKIFDVMSIDQTQSSYLLYQSIIEKANFNSYQDFKNRAASLGISIPVAEALIPLNASFQSNDGKFLQQIDTFLDRSYFETRSDQRFKTYQQNLSNNAKDVMLACFDVASGSNGSEGLFVTALQQDLSMAGFNVIIRQNFASIKDINDIAWTPSTDLMCTHNGKQVKPPITIKNAKTVVLSCTKSPKKAMSAVFTTRDSINAQIVNLEGEDGKLQQQQAQQLADLEERMVKMNNVIISMDKQLSAKVGTLDPSTIKIISPQRATGNNGEKLNMTSSEGICFLASAAGVLMGNGEAGVVLDNNNEWIAFGTYGGQLKTMCIKYRK